MKNLVSKFFDYYYYIYVLLGIFSFIGLSGMNSFENTLSVISVCIFLIARKIRFNNSDILFLVFLFYQLISIGFSNYPIYFWYISIKTQIVPMLFYFIGRYMKMGEFKILDNMKKPMIFAMVFGLILYFWSPNWYIERKTMSLATNASSSALYERTRLSSFWPWSYTMGYGALFYLMYYMKEMFEKKIRWKNIICLIIATLVLFFAQQRVSIAFFFVFMGLITVFNPYRNRKRIIFIWAFLAIVSLVIFILLVNYMDSELIDYIMTRSVDNEDNMVDERFSMFSRFFDVSFLGNGMGKFGHIAYYMAGGGVTDCEYIRMIAELGILGCSLLGMIFLNALFKGFVHIKTYIFEFSVVAFYLAAMIGATPFENYSMQNFLFWFCVGRLFNSKLMARKHNNSKLITKINYDRYNHSQLQQ